MSPLYPVATSTLRALLVWTVALGCLTFPAVSSAAPTPSVSTITLGIFLPQARFDTNSERGAYAQKLAERLNAAAKGAFRFEARAFARRSDLLSFTKAKRIDLLIADGLFMAGRDEAVVAYSADAVAAVLYAPRGTDLASLKGKAVAIAQVGPQDARFFINTALSGEVLADYFGPIRATKDAAAALGAVKTGAAAAAFASDKHPAAKGLSIVARGGSLTLAACAVIDPAHATPDVVAIITSALVGGAGRGGGITLWRAGAANLANVQRAAAAQPIAATAPAVLTTAGSERPAPPPIRLRIKTKLPQLTVRPELSVTPELPEEPL